LFALRFKVSEKKLISNVSLFSFQTTRISFVLFLSVFA
jgi:hypothetical protein